jgi:hypothetical protein
MILQETNLFLRPKASSTTWDGTGYLVLKRGETKMGFVEIHTNLISGMMIGMEVVWGQETTSVVFDLLIVRIVLTFGKIEGV